MSIHRNPCADKKFEQERLLVASSVERNGIPSVFPKDSSATAVRRSSIWSREKEYLRVFSSGGGRTHTCTEHNFFRHFLRFFLSISSYTLIHDITFLGSGTTSWATWLDHNPLDRIRNSSDVPMKKCKKYLQKENENVNMFPKICKQILQYEAGVKFCLEHFQLKSVWVLFVSFSSNYCHTTPLMQVMWFMNIEILLLAFFDLVLALFHCFIV